MRERTTATRPGPTAARVADVTGELLGPQPPAAGQSADARLAPAFSALDGDDIAVVSVDVFDTLLWRRVAEPENAFALVGARLAQRGMLADDVWPDVFAGLRAEAEERARAAQRAAGGGPEVTLAAIYEELPERVFAGAGRTAAVEHELEVERDLLVCDLDVLALIRAARERGKRVVAVSDTYFDEPQLRRLLDRPPLRPEEVDAVFASSAHGAGKGSGLWSLVLEALGCRPEQVLHVGDNHDADVRAAQALGVRPVFFERRPAALQRALRREAALPGGGPDPAQGDHGLSAVRAKTLHRAERETLPSELRPYWEYGAAALGPVLAGFAEWAQERGRAAGVSKLFCLMREGELLSGLINAAAPAAADPVRAQPIWLSRQVCARAAIVEGAHEELEALFVRRNLPTLREFCATLGLEPGELPTLSDRADARLDDAGLGDAVIDEIVYDAELRNRVVAASRELRRRVVRSVQEQVPAGERRIVLVDLGWGATVQGLLQKLLRADGVECEVAGLYLVTRDQAAERMLDGLEIHGFLGSAGRPEPAVEAIMRSPEILEQVCMPDFGSQVDLSPSLEPVLAEVGEIAHRAPQRAAVQQGIAAFQREWVRYRSAREGALPLLSGAAARAQLRVMLFRAVAAPAPEEAAILAGWVHDENFGSEAFESVVAGPAAKAVRHSDPRTLVQIPMTDLYWPYGLAALHDEPLAASVAAASSGLVPWEAFGSELETGEFEVFPDIGWGFSAAGSWTVTPRRNRNGLSYVRAVVAGDFVKRVRLDPAQRPCVLRLDWIRLRCRVHDAPEPVTIDFEHPRDFARISLRGARWIGPKLLLVEGDDPQLVIAVEAAAGRPVYRVVVECAYAALPIARSQARERHARLKAWLRRMAKESPAGAPVRLARRMARR
jgi:FMN phosphatase YigB (HAD superfamily)